MRDPLSRSCVDREAASVAEATADLGLLRVTLDIDDDVLRAAKELAAAKQTTAGRILSDLAREVLTKGGTGGARARNGSPLLAKRGAVVTVELVDKLAEE